MTLATKQEIMTRLYEAALQNKNVVNPIGFMASGEILETIDKLSSEIKNRG